MASQIGESFWPTAGKCRMDAAVAANAAMGVFARDWRTGWAGFVLQSSDEAKSGKALWP